MSAADCLLDYAQADERLGCSIRSARRLVARKLLRAVVIGHRTVRFRPADLERAAATLAGERKAEW
jgi:hypothetical protein